MLGSITAELRDDIVGAIKFAETLSVAEVSCYANRLRRLNSVKLVCKELGCHPSRRCMPGTQPGHSQLWISHLCDHGTM